MYNCAKISKYYKSAQRYNVMELHNRIKYNIPLCDSITLCSCADYSVIW